ncbi:Lactate dehydrogenase [Noviherbaspirillum humi]|uniref:Lactate dehydrogenase n=1 Tax=Noviherbaspirillum humi TaxID=1688639 RepID=A0A239F3M1_9BURK|nr:2-hydroxyacid dehydrogenase [Noviherbaspirillum humi]SNS51516.1 Lactate dehydrogenase [Noviherbaspirillum humi]
MNKTILQHGRLLPSLEAALAGEFDIHPLWAESDPQAFLARHGGRFAGLVTSAQVGADAALMRALPSLKVISSFGVGFDKIDVDAARSLGIRVSNTPDVLNDCVADLTLGLIIDAARGLSAADRFVRRGEWQQGRFRLATRVTGKRLGIVGLGRIGRAVAKRAAGFDMEIRYTNSRPAENAPHEFMPALRDLAAWADFLVVTVAGGAGTHKLISADILSALGSKGFLINVSRGTVVDEEALVRALATGGIAGAGLDVFVDEPNVPPALLELDNVVLLPHIASGTHETRQAMADLVLQNLRGYFNEGALVTPVA